MKRTADKINQMIDAKLRSDSFTLIKYQTMHSMLISYKEQAQMSLSITLVAIFSIVVIQSNLLLAVIDGPRTSKTICEAIFATALCIIGIATAWVGRSVFKKHKSQIDNCCKKLSSVEAKLNEADSDQTTEEVFLGDAYNRVQNSLIAWIVFFVFMLICWVLYLAFLK